MALLIFSHPCSRKSHFKQDVANGSIITIPKLKGRPEELKTTLDGAIEVLDAMPGDAVKF